MTALPSEGSRTRPGAPPTRPERRWQRRLATGGLIALAGLLLLGVGAASIANTVQGTRFLAQRLLVEVGERTAEEMRSTLAQAGPPLEFLHDRLRDDDSLAAGEPLAAGSPAWLRRARLLAEGMRAHHGLWQAYFADIHGNFTLLHRGAPDAYEVEDSWLQDGRTVRRRYRLPALDGHAALPEAAPDYDPRIRPWYRHALARGGFSWTEPYPFIHGGQTGISAVAPVARDGRTVGVVGADVPLERLCSLLRLLPLGRPGLVFVLGDNGRLVAWPYQDSRPAGAPSSHDAVFRAAATRLTGEPAPDGSPEFLDLPGTGQDAGHLGVALPLDPAAPGAGRIVALLPRDDVLLPVLARNRMTAGAGVVALLTGLLLMSWVRRLSSDVGRCRQVGSYTLEELLGRGGMGEVWRGRHRLLARPAAIKLIHAQALGSIQGETSVHPVFRRFVREAKATAALDSPHTVRLLDFGITADGAFYYVMELLEGFDIETLVQRFGPVEPALAVHMLRQACSSLEEAHAAGLVHRDVKPSNLFACRIGVDVDFVKVLDFGLVKEQAAVEAPLTVADALFGTPSYMAPEQAMSRPVDGRADVYALACVGYWLLTGRPVFTGSTAVQILVRHASEAPEPPSVLAAGVPPELDALLLRCLEKDPARRPDARELSEQLRDIPGLALPPTDERRRWWAENLPRVGEPG